MTGAAASGSADFLILLVCDLRRPEVGDGGGHHQHVRVGRVLGDRVGELGGRADVDHVHSRRVDQARRIARDQRDVGAALGHHPSHRKALLARTAVADETHRVDRLAGAAGADEDPHAGQVIRQGVAAVQQQLGERGDLLGLGQPACAAVGAGEASGRRLQDDRAPTAQRGDVVDGGRVKPHLGVHRGREEHRTSRGEQRGGQEVVGTARDGPRQQVGGRRGDHDEVGLLPDPDMRHLVDVIPDAGVNGIARTAPRRSRRR